MLAQVLSLLAVAGSALAAPTVVPSSDVQPRSGVSALSSSAVSALSVYTSFSRAAYCPSNKILTSTSSWSCGEACAALPGFVPYITGGNGGSVPLFFVGYWPAQNTAVVVHEGTDPLQLESDLTDLEVLFGSLSSSLFPGLSSSVQVHSGFASAQAASATTVLSTVKKIFSDHGISKVTLVGHSLGGAISTIDLLYLKLNLPSSTTFKLVVHGSPRVGNQDFATYIDNHFTDVTRVNHAEDLIPIVPGRFLGYHHISGEVHINYTGTWVACTGEDNTDINCSTGDVGNILEGSILDHLGPYNGVYLGTIYCY